MGITDIDSFFLAQIFGYIQKEGVNVVFKKRQDEL